MQYPLEITFKAIALSNQVTVTDAAGNEVMYVKQKAFKIKETIEIYKDKSRAELLSVINADRIIDFSPLLKMHDTNGVELGSVKRQGRKSLWRASYVVTLDGREFARVSETNPWAKVMDGLFSQIPVLGIFAGYLFHPVYEVMQADGSSLATIEKRPALLEGKFMLKAQNALSILDEPTQFRLVTLLMIVTLFERVRG